MTTCDIQQKEVAVSPPKTLTYEDLIATMKTFSLSLFAVGASAILDYLIKVFIPSVPQDNPYWMLLSPMILGALKLMQAYLSERYYPKSTNE